MHLSVQPQQHEQAVHHHMFLVEYLLRLDHYCRHQQVESPYPKKFLALEGQHQQVSDIP